MKSRGKTVVGAEAEDHSISGTTVSIKGLKKNRLMFVIILWEIIETTPQLDECGGQGK